MVLVMNIKTVNMWTNGRHRCLFRGALLYNTTIELSKRRRIANHLWQGGQGRGQGGWQRGQMPGNGKLISQLNGFQTDKYKRQSGKWAKDGNGNYHLEAGVTVVGPHLDSARQLAQSDHNVSHVAMCYNVSHVTCHRLGVSPSWNPSWGAHQEFVQNPRADVNFVFPWIQNQQWLEINATVWFPPLHTIGWEEMAFLCQIQFV